MKTVYIETSIPSFYHETREEPEMVARRHWTRRWWDQCASRYDLVTSEGVVAELQQGECETQAAAVELLADLPLLEVVDEIADIIEVYLANHLMPKERLGDALHLALASYHKCDFLLTLELYAHRKRQRVSAYPRNQYTPWAVRPHARDTYATV